MSFYIAVSKCIPKMFIIKKIILCSVIPWEAPEGKSGQQAVEMLQQRVELLGAQKTGNWSVDCEAYHSLTAHSK